VPVIITGDQGCVDVVPSFDEVDGLAQQYQQEEYSAFGCKNSVTNESDLTRATRNANKPGGLIGEYLQQRFLIACWLIQS
jgi:dihydroorotate dehydrogenase